MGAIERLVELAHESPTSSDWRSAALSVVREQLTFDCASYVDMRADAQHDPRTVIDIPLTVLDGLRPHWNGILEELPDVVGLMQREGVASIAQRYPMRRREHLRMFRHGHGPLGMTSDLQCFLPVRNDMPVILALGRRGGAHFGERDLEQMKQLRAILLVGEAAVRYRSQRAHARVALETLTPKQRKLVDFVALGHTNEAIGRTLGLSPLSVRNALSRLYRRFDVASRAELVGLLARRE